MIKKGWLADGLNRFPDASSWRLLDSMNAEWLPTATATMHGRVFEYGTVM
jgi:hypothetical protein